MEFVVVKVGEGSERPVRQAELLTLRAMILPRKTQESRSLIRIVFIGRKRVAGDNAPRRRTPWDSVV